MRLQERYFYRLKPLSIFPYLMSLVFISARVDLGDEGIKIWIQPQWSLGHQFLPTCGAFFIPENRNEKLRINQRNSLRWHHSSKFLSNEFHSKVFFTWVVIKEMTINSKGHGTIYHAKAKLGATKYLEKLLGGWGGGGGDLCNLS